MGVTTDRILAVSVLLLTSCAVVLTGFNVRRTYTEWQPPPPDYIVPDWRQFAQSGHRLGSADAKVTVIMFSDYQCPACESAMNELENLRRKHSRAVSVVLRHYPAATHRYAEGAARAAICGEKQGKFEPINRLLFLKADSFAVQSFADVAAAAGVADIAAFNTCMAEPRTLSAVVGDMAAGRAINLVGTPTLLVNGEQYTGTQGLRSIVKQHLRSVN